MRVGRSPGVGAAAGCGRLAAGGRGDIGRRNGSANSPLPTPRRPAPALALLLRGLLGLALLAVLLAAGHALLWRWMGSQLEAGFQDWAAQRRALGWRVEMRHRCGAAGRWRRR